ncbi:putative membrane protein [Natronincola peptidivorans]|uniref:Putative membrane protein n=1 Tax=Natronincola peptidivorans TaxID=426128 RepID=A0A1I0DYM1_9FIRM|nr:TIGR03943 family protein [Natronincola peptidivorans]SET36975.1 putative membrane protein [Natronincola peptidivorans]
MKKINIKEVIWLGIMAAISYIIYHMLLTGKVLNFVYVRMNQFVIASLIVFILLTILQIRNITRKRPNQKIKIGFFILIVPLIIAAVLSPKGLNEEEAVKKGVTIANTQSVNENGSLGKTIDASLSHKKEGLLEIKAEVFDEVLQDIRNNTDDYLGQRVRIAGFIDRQESYPDHHFVVARMLMVCCAADTLVVGLLAEWEGIQDFEEFQWVEVEGVIDKTDFYDVWLDQEYVAPIIRVEEIKEIERPAVVYVYPADNEDD